MWYELWVRAFTFRTQQKLQRYAVVIAFIKHAAKKNEYSPVKFTLVCTPKSMRLYICVYICLYIYAFICILGINTWMSRRSGRRAVLIASRVVKLHSRRVQSLRDRVKKPKRNVTQTERERVGGIIKSRKRGSDTQLQVCVYVYIVLRRRRVKHDKVRINSVLVYRYKRSLYPKRRNCRQIKGVATRSFI